MKIALLFICVNQPYWPYLRDVINDAKTHFLKDHQVDFYTWSDMPEDTNYGATVFPIEPAPWPMATLMRYHLFVQQEDILKDYDYVFYMDVDMRIVDAIGNEILGENLTAAVHPGYYIRKELLQPQEPNPNSTAFLPIPKFYYAGGFQGGKTKEFIKAMWAMKRNIDLDFNHNYMSRWNDESHWNRYLYDNPPSIVLSPSYIYPDSLIKEYYEPIVWGQSFVPKIITLTKPFSVSKEGGEAVKRMIAKI